MELGFEIQELKTRHAFSIARAAAPPVRRGVWIRLRDADGVEGWGEAAPNAYYGETAETVAAVLPRYAQVLAHAGGFELERIEARLEHAVGGNASARAALSAALHDLLGRRCGVPVWKLWGLSPADAPRSSFTIGIDEPELMRERVLEAASFPILKVKVGTDRDEQVLRTVREAAPDATIRVDANTGWTLKQALRAIPLLDEIGIELVEQPLPAHDLDGMLLLREHLRVPLIVDESCRTVADIPRLVGCVDGINIKLAKCGSLREAIRMVHVARAHGLSVMIGCMVETTLAIAAAVQLAPLVDYIDLDGAALLEEDPFDGPGIERDGTLRFNSEPGLGVTRPDQTS